MSDQYQSIPTIYNGITFRSRLEARWAVFYDELGIAYQYEPEGYDLSFAKLGYYLPDFWISDWDCFVEIKPKHPTLNETLKVQALAEATGSTAFIFGGQLSDFIYEDGIIFAAGFPEDQDLSKYCPSCPMPGGCPRWDDDWDIQRDFSCYVNGSGQEHYCPTNGFIRADFGQCKICGKIHLFKFDEAIGKKFSDCFWSHGFCCDYHLFPEGWLMVDWEGNRLPINEHTESKFTHKGKLRPIYAAFRNAIRYSFWNPTVPTQSLSIKGQRAKAQESIKSEFYFPKPIKTTPSWKTKKKITVDLRRPKQEIQTANS